MKDVLIYRFVAGSFDEIGQVGKVDEEVEIGETRATQT